MFGRRSLVVLLAAALCLSNAAGTARGQDVEQWRGTRTDNFLLVGNASNNAIKRVAERLEEFRTAVITLLPALLPDYVASDENETTVVVFRHDRAFDPYKPPGADDVAGYFSAGNFRNYIALTGDRELERAIYHEYVHRLTAGSPSWRPWMSEGVAELYSTIEVRDGGRKIRVGTTIPEHLAILSQRHVPLEGLFQSDPEYLRQADRQHLFYAQSWAMLHYLKFGNPELGAQLPLFNQALASGNDIPTSVRLAFGMDIDTLESEYLLYVRNSVTFRATEYTLTNALEEVEAEDTEDISQAEEDFYQGDLLRQIGRLEESRVHLERAIEARPESGPALMAMFLLADREGNTEEAARYLERAALAPDSGYAPRLIYAQRSLVEGNDASREQAETLLRTVVQMRPRMPDGFLWLGHALMQRREGVPEAVSVLETARRLSQGDPETTFAYAQALWLNGDDQDAVTALEVARSRTIDPVLRNRIEDFQARLEREAARSGAFEERARAAAAARPPDAPIESRNAPRLERPTPPVEDESGAPRRSEIRLLPPDGMLQAEGYLTQLVCGDALRVVVTTEAETEEFVSRTPEEVEFLSYSPDVQEDIACGEVDPPAHVRITYRPVEDPEASADLGLGDPWLIEFLNE